jgi:hypothetical protein
MNERVSLGKVSATPGSRGIAGRDHRRPRPGAVPPVGRLLRRLLADVLPQGDFIVGDRDVLLGTIGDTPVYISESQYEAWKHTDLTIDVVPGRGGMFSLDNGREKRFLTRSTVCAVPS